MDTALIDKNAKAVDTYMRFRARLEGVEYDLPLSTYEVALRSGVNTFFGVTVVNGELISDAQQPELLRMWKKMIRS